MAEFTLNIYGENDEVIKTYETQRIRWGIFIEACKLQDKIGAESIEAQIGAITGFMKSIFPGITDEELKQADAFDIFATFKQIVKQAEKINGIDAGNA